MAVVTAGVHHAVFARRMRDARRLHNRQRIHIRAQANGAVGIAASQCRDHAMPADAGDERHAEFGQPRLHEGRGLLFMQRQFRIGVQMASPSGQGFVQRAIHQPFTFRMISAHWSRIGKIAAALSEFQTTGHAVHADILIAA